MCLSCPPSGGEKPPPPTHRPSAELLARQSSFSQLGGARRHAVESLSPAISVSVRVDRTSLRELYFEALDALHHRGLYRADWATSGEDGGEGRAGCTCHRDVVKMETIGAWDERAGGEQGDAERGAPKARRESGQSSPRGFPERCWDCCDSWEEAIGEERHGCLPEYGPCYAAFEEHQRAEFIECANSGKHPADALPDEDKR